MGGFFGRPLRCPFGALGLLAALLAAPAAAQPAHAASASSDTRVMVSLDARRLWVVRGTDTLFTAPVAVGKGGDITIGDRTYEFSTPRGVHRVLAKLDDPSWVPPDWHYYEKAAARGLEPVQLEDGDMIELSDATYIQVRGTEVGRINRWGNYYPFNPGSEIIFDGKIFIPPLHSPQRRIPDALGPVKLMLGDGYLIHGTHRYNEGSIGTAASHGCIRMNNEDVLILRDLVRVGTPVNIY
jgi:hypothetical protein